MPEGHFPTMVIHPKSKNDNKADSYFNRNTDLSLGAKTCGSGNKIEDRIEAKIVCPRCGYHQNRGSECLRCGVIFLKINDKELISNPVDADDLKFEDIQTGKRNKIIKSWICFSIVYLIGVILYSMAIFQNERDRPYRDRLFATAHLIEYSDFEAQAEAIKEELEDMIDRRVRKSIIYDYIESRSEDLDHGVVIRKSNAMIKATFRNGTILKFVDRNSSAYLVKPEIPHSDLFTVFPSLTELHTRYKDINYDEKAVELQEMYDDLNYELIEHKFDQCVKWFIPRFILFAFLLWGIPVCLVFLAVCFKIRFQQA